MCIIVYKPAGVNFPNNEIIENCFNRNKDGAGFMYPDGDKVNVRKGFMTLKDFNEAITPFKNFKDIPFVMHFRISTHAGVIPEMTQPFPVTSKSKKLRSLDTSAKVGVAHNGIISMTNDAKTMSDTALFIKRYMSFLVKDVEFYKDQRIPAMIEAMIGSKMAVLSADGHCELLGKGWTESEGIWYSNTTYKTYKSYTTKSSYTRPFRYEDGTYDYQSYLGWGGEAYGYYGYYNSKYDKDEYDEDGFSKYDPTKYEDDWWDGYIDNATWDYYVSKAHLSPEEEELYFDMREDCEQRIQSGGADCYSCRYCECCYAI